MANRGSGVKSKLLCGAKEPNYTGEITNRPGDTEVSMKLIHLDNFVAMKDALLKKESAVEKSVAEDAGEQSTNREPVKKHEPKDANDAFYKVMADVLEDVNIKKNGMSAGKYTTIKSVTSGVLNISLFELTVVALKELVQAGKENEPFYGSLLGIYVVMLILQVLGLIGLSYLALQDFEKEKLKVWLNRINNAVGFAASLLLILGTAAAALKSDKESLAINKFVERLKEQNVTVDFSKLLN